MKIRYDKKADAMYIKFRNGAFAKNKVLDKDTILDLDKNGEPLGLELLSASKRLPLKDLSSLMK